MREEKNASFGINLDTGAWKDHANDDKGDIVTLTERVLNKDNTEAIKWIKQNTSLASKLYGAPISKGHSKPTPTKEKPKLFWTPERKQLWRKAKKRLKAESNHSVIEMANQRECLKHETLKVFHCGILNGKEIGWSDSDWLLMPFDTGAKLYLVNKQKYKSITPHRKEKPKPKGPGSKPAKTFFGKDRAKGDKKRLFIAKSPRETMLLWQLFGHRADVIGLATGEQPRSI